MAPATGPRRIRNGESGHLMAGLTVVVAILLIASTVAFQQIAEATRRENEAEMMFRAQDFTRALYRFEKANGRLPNSMEEFQRAGPSGQYFLRQAWKDPLVPDGKFGFLFVGPGGAIFDPTAAFGVPGLGGLNGGAGNVANPLGDSLANDSSFSNGAGFNNDEAAEGSEGRSGEGRGGKPGERGANGSAFGSGKSRLNPDGQAGGLPIAGVKSLATDPPFRIYNGFSEYSQWLFTVQDLKQQLQKLPGGRRKRPQGSGGGLSAPDKNLN